MNTVPTVCMVVGMMMMLVQFHNPATIRPLVDRIQLGPILRSIYPPSRFKASDDSRAMARSIKQLDDMQ